MARSEWKRLPFGCLADGQAANLYRATSASGTSVAVTDFGCAIVSIDTPGRNGEMADVVLGFDVVAGYERNQHSLGCIVGRYANRVANGQFWLDATPYRLATNNGSNHLHGGTRGFSHYLWECGSSRANTLRFTHVSPAGNEGYPGELKITCGYTLEENGALQIDYMATTDASTVINLTNHSYFNLAGHQSGSVLDHVLQLDADAYTPTDDTQIPTGEIRSVADSPFDFRSPAPLGLRIDGNDPQLAIGHGYDHNFVLHGNGNSRDGGDALHRAAVACDPHSGRQLTVFTTEPGLQLYTANWLMETGKAAYGPRQAFCLETQHFPDSPNRPEFPSTRLDVGQTYRSRTVYQFSVEGQPHGG